ncbi:MAG TPA: dephospho-CoA kinase [Streptosporangiaceae bacterium]
MLRVGLTGGIGSGKSQVSSRLAARGAFLIDADVSAREVVEPGTPGLGQIVAVFGPGVLLPDGRLNRERLGQLVFGDDDLRAKLNAIVHPLVRERAQQLEQQAAAILGPDGIVVHDVPLLAENGLQSGFDTVIVVDAPDDQRLLRLTRDRGMTAAHARERMAAQARRDQRLAIADIVVDNSGTLADLDRQVTDVWSVLRDLAAGRDTRRVADPDLRPDVSPDAGPDLGPDARPDGGAAGMSGPPRTVET